MQNDKPISNTPNEKNRNPFPDWDHESEASDKKNIDQDTSFQSKYDKSTPKLFLNSQIYSIDNYRKLSYIKKTFNIVYILNIICGIIGIILFLIPLNSFIYFRNNMNSYDWIFYISVMIISSLGIFIAAFQYLPKRKHTLTILSVSLIAYIIYAVTLLPLLIIGDLGARFILSESNFIKAIFIDIVLIILFSYLRMRISTVNDYYIDLERCGMDINREELQRILATTITENDSSFWRLRLEITRGSLSDRLEDTLLIQLKHKGSITEPAMKRLKEPSFLTHFINFIKYPRFIIAYSLLSATFYTAVITYIYQYYDVEKIYRQRNNLNSYYSSLFDSDCIPYFLIIFQTAYFILAGLIKHNPIASIYAYKINNYILSFLVIAIHFYVFIFSSPYYYMFNSSGKIALFIFSLVVGSLLPIMVSLRYVRRFPKAYRSILDYGILPNYYDLRRVMDAYLIIAGYQRYVENADEDGWE